MRRPAQRSTPLPGSWFGSPPRDLKAGDFTATLVAQVPLPERRLEQPIRFTLADPNLPPKLEPVGKLEVISGKTLLVPLLASDPEGGQVTLSLRDAPEGLQIDQGGALKWEVPSSFLPSEVTATLVATDSAQPPLAAEQTLTIDVRENLTPYVVLVGYIGPDQDVQAWLHDRAEERSYFLKPGQSFDIAGIKGTLTSIQLNDILYTHDGKTWRLSLGQVLSEAEPVEPTVSLEEAEAMKQLEAMGMPGQPLEAPRPQLDTSSGADNTTPQPESAAAAIRSQQISPE